MLPLPLPPLLLQMRRQSLCHQWAFGKSQFDLMMVKWWRRKKGKKSLWQLQWKAAAAFPFQLLQLQQPMLMKTLN